MEQPSKLCREMNLFAFCIIIYFCAQCSAQLIKNQPQTCVARSSVFIACSGRDQWGGLCGPIIMCVFINSHDCMWRLENK